MYISFYVCYDVIPRLVRLPDISIYGLSLVGTAVRSQHELEQLERLRSEDTPWRPVITHTMDQFILNPKSILLTSSYRITSQKKVKTEKIRKIANNLNFRIFL